jgi:3',5'-cyclic AMP phosphodiesterase CpdA
MKILHFSDLHVWRRRLDFRDPALKRFLGFGNLLLRRGRAFPVRCADRVIQEIHRFDPADLVVAEFQAARDLLAPLRQKWGDRFFLIPGNHDRYTPRTLERGLFEASFSHARFDRLDRPVRSTAVTERLAVVGFDCSVPRLIASTGLFTESLAQALDEELGLQETTGRKVVLVGHYPYAVPERVRVSRGHRLVGADRLEAVVARRKPILYLHGHKHRRWAFRPGSTPETLCVNAGSAGLLTTDPRTRAGFVVITLDEGLRPVDVEGRVLPLALEPARAPGETACPTAFDALGLL